MRLKQIKLAGFKSFVDLTTVPFPQQMTAVVGPNGCGKSNVIDAVRWVLGESSAKNLRGDAMTDVIFNGSAQRKPVSQASVELVFENTQGRISGSLADRSEIAVKRIVTRDAQSLYFLNGTKCRRRDITDIFLGTGLGPRSYAIIEQGMISRLIESKPQELRVFIEEAAGISKYKERRRETENRIKHTRDNLDRLSDVREELAKNIEKLKRQASAAQRYKELKAQERKLKAELTTIKWLQYNNQLQVLEQQQRQQETELEKYQSGQLGGQRELLELKEQSTTGRQLLEQVQSRFYQSGSHISRLEQQILHQRQQQQTLHSQLQQARQALQQALHYVHAEQQQANELQQQTEQDQPALELLTEQVEELQQQLLLLEDQQQQQQQALLQWQRQHFSLQQQQQQQQLQVQNQQQQLQQNTQQQQQLQQELAGLSSAELQQQLAGLLTEREVQQQLLQQQQQKLTEAQQHHQQQLQQLQQLQQQDARSHNQLQLLEQEQLRLQRLQEQQSNEQQQLLQQLDVKPGWALAVAVALGQLQHAVIQTASEQAAQQGHAISFVAALSSAAPANSLGSVVVSGSYPEYFHHILLADSNIMLEKPASGQSVINSNGCWQGVNWQLLPSAEQQDGYLLRQQRLQELQHHIPQIQQQWQQLQQQIEVQQAASAEAGKQLQQQQYSCNECQQQLQQRDTGVLLLQQQLQHTEKHQLKLQAEIAQQQLRQAQLEESIALLLETLESSSEQLAEHENDQAQLLQFGSAGQQKLLQQKQQFEQLRQQQQQLLMQLNIAGRQQQNVQQNISRGQQQVQQLQEQQFQLEQQLAGDGDPEILLQEQLQEFLLQREQAEQMMAEHQNTLSELEQKIRQLEQGQQGFIQLLNQKQQQLAELRLDAEGCRVRANNMMELLRDQQASMKDVLAELPADADEKLWQQQLDKTSDAVSRLGAINLAAIEEYEQQAERKQYLDNQNDDLAAALDTLETAIRKIDKETRQKFKETFEQVNDGLKNLFPKVFGGGSAYLDLTEDDLLETGVTIMARPPGKKNSTIHLLSGGEKALTALSLVFSIFRLNPAPFCMLDEVDAPLDDANVGRFCNLVRQMSETVQFIYISHNKIAMEMAAQLMGVTMQEPGVSRVVAVDVDDAVKMTATA